MYSQQSIDNNNNNKNKNNNIMIATKNLILIYQSMFTCVNKIMDYAPFLWPFVSYRVSDFYKRLLNKSILAETHLGPVQGLKQLSSDSNAPFEYYEFRGIPYGKPPIGPLRFKDPEQPEPWYEPIVTRTDVEACQRDMVFRNLKGSEDCLRLNVYTKDLQPEKLCPVMVFIHGGAFMYGSGVKDMYNPEYLLRKDVIVIVLNYRVGVFGFLSFDDPNLEIPGNAGLKDQVLALKWINRNAAHFGGDPANVTLFGQSAGGVSVNYHMLSEMSNGLFHRACAMSGSALNVWALSDARRKQFASRLAKTLGWNGAGGDPAILNVLLKTPAMNLVKAQDCLTAKQEFQNFNVFSFGPVIEAYKSDQSFLLDSVHSLIENPWSCNIPMMIGACSGEGLFAYSVAKSHKKCLIRLNEYPENIIPEQICIDQRRNNAKYRQIGLEIKKKYFGDEKISLKNLMKFIQMYGDLWFWHGIYQALKTRLLHPNGGETYFYRFDFHSDIQNHTKLVFASRRVEGACHGDDCPYLFKNAITVETSQKSREYKMVQRMIDLWTNFAKTGKPFTQDDSGNNLCWEPISQMQQPMKCLNITDSLNVINWPEFERMQFLDLLYDKLDLN